MVNCVGAVAGGWIPQKTLNFGSDSNASVLRGIPKNNSDYVAEVYKMEIKLPDSENLCPEMKEYLEWYNREFVPALKKLAAHVISCPRCRDLTIAGKDQAALEMLMTTDKQLEERLREAAEK